MHNVLIVRVTSYFASSVKGLISYKTFHWFCSAAFIVIVGKMFPVSLLLLATCSVIPVSDNDFLTTDLWIMVLVSSLQELSIRSY